VEVAQPLMAAGPTTGNQGGDYIQSASAVRRLTPTECERLQGFPDGHTRIPMRRYAKRRITKNRPADMWERDAEGHWWLMAADGPRYKALGNSMAVEVMHWIGARIDAFERGILDAWQWSPGRWRVGGRWELAA
jgi:DNA (cytosine-5)-methyltransferase 1